MRGVNVVCLKRLGIARDRLLAVMLVMRGSGGDGICLVLGDLGDICLRMARS